ncbi:hypothetical protein [Sphingomonas bacterium]|uniref:hypothetical protein n=1 Tax=Sphingomonas bacterium TaxID=1895847 RepID=UPI0015771C08|nr:hypothetical protein [Sphingomonas bacterium]
MTPVAEPVLFTEASSPRPELRRDWFHLIVDASVNMDGAGVYQWSIEGEGLYVGKAKVLRKRLRDYPQNVRSMIEGRFWHGDPTKDYRAIHHQLRKAYDAEICVVVTVLETCDAAVRSERERWWITLRRREEAGGGPRVLNGS